MKSRVLIVSPHFPPINAADHHRIRMSLPYFAEFGWEVTVLAVKPDKIEGIYDQDLLATVPANIEVIYADAISPQLARKLKLGNLAMRSLPSLIKSVATGFKQKRFDLVYFSNTVFLTMVLGRYWLAKYQVPYVLDFQDPWLNDYYERTHTKPPGGVFKYKISQILAQILEPFVIKKASHLISVSPAYPEMLTRRYPWLSTNRCTVLPFGAPEYDFQVLSKLNSGLGNSGAINHQIFDPQDGDRHWVYVGRGGKDMEFSLRLLFTALRSQRQREPEVWRNLKIHFVGTKYSIFDHSKEIEAIAKSYDLGDMVTEYPQRIPYFAALQLLTDSHGILIIGSDDQGYSASKVYPCILAQRPILAILQEQSLVVQVLETCQAGRVVTFNQNMVETDNLEPALEGMTRQLQRFLSQSQDGNLSNNLPTNWQAFQTYTARTMTQQQCAIFDGYVSPRQPC